MPRHPNVNPALRPYHPYTTTQPLKTLRVTTIPQCTARSPKSSPVVEMLEPRPSHYAPLRSYSPQPEIYNIVYTDDYHRCCASTSRMTLEMQSPHSDEHHGCYSPDFTSKSNHYGTAPPPHTTTSTSSPVISLHPAYHQPLQHLQQLSPVDLPSPLSASPYDPIADDYPMQQDEAAAGAEASDSDESDAEPVLHQPKPRRRIPILSLADLADAWQIDEHGESTTQHQMQIRRPYP